MVHAGLALMSSGTSHEKGSVKEAAPETAGAGTAATPPTLAQGSVPIARGESAEARAARMKEEAEQRKLAGRQRVRRDTDHALSEKRKNLAEQQLREEEQRRLEKARETIEVANQRSQEVEALEAKRAEKQARLAEIESNFLEELSRVESLREEQEAEAAVLAELQLKRAE